jgi:uncharacterized protein
MKMFRVLWFCALLGVLLTAGALGVGARAEKVATMPAPMGYVDDYAGVISAPAKAELEALCREVHDKTKAQVFFVTVKTLDGEAMEPFANELFHTWKIGEKKTDRGILLVLAITEHQRRIEVGYGLEGILNDAKVGDIGREMVPALKAANYDEAARIGVRAVSKVIADDSGVTLDTLGGGVAPESLAATQPVVREQSGEKTMPWVVAAAPFGLFFFVFGLLVWRAVKRGVTFGGGGGGMGGSDGGSSFGGGGGDSDGGGFSGGDGGDSGGGGAGGSW